MSFGNAVASGLSGYATFSGRARRSEFWWFYLFTILVVVLGAVLDAVLGTEPLLYMVAILGLMVPNVAVGIRRLHDLGKSGWFYLVFLIPLVGAILMIVFLVQDGVPGPNEHGPNPKGDDQLGYHPPGSYA